MWYFKEEILDGKPHSERALLGSFKPEQKLIMQRVSDNEMMNVKLCSVVDPQIGWETVFTMHT